MRQEVWWTDLLCRQLTQEIDRKFLQVCAESSLRRATYRSRYMPKRMERQMLERRKEAREAVLLRAVAIFNGLRRECTLTNLSTKGASLKFDGFVGLPDKFDLFIPEKQTTYRALTRWRLDNQVGIVFEGQLGQERQDQAAMMQRIQELEAELQELRAQVGV